MHSHQQANQTQNSKYEVKFSNNPQAENMKPYVHYANELQELLYAKIDEYETFKETIKSKLKG